MNKFNLKHILIGLSLSLISNISFAQTTLKSGLYEQLMIAVDTNGHLTGVYNESIGLNRMTCEFFIKGKINKSNNSLEIQTYSTLLPGIYPGKLSFNNNEINLIVKDGTNHPGCAMVLMPEIETTGLTLDKTKDTQWTHLMMVKYDKASLFTKPDQSAIIKQYLVKENVIGVLSSIDGWTNIEYINDNGKSLKAWIKSKDLNKI